MPKFARGVHDGGDGRYILKKGVIKNQLAGDALTAYTAREIATKHKATVKPHYCLEKKPVPGDNEGYEVKDLSFDSSGTYLAVAGSDVRVYLCKQWDVLKVITNTVRI